MPKKSFLLLLIFFLSLCSGCGDRFTQHYATYTDAVEDGAVKRGWIPLLVPESATNIHEQHDIDTNEVWLRFDVAAAEKEKIVFDLEKLTHEEIEKLHLRYPSRVNWWFEGLAEQQPANDNALSADIYHVPANIYHKKGGYLAVDRASENVYYWTGE